MTRKALLISAALASAWIAPAHAQDLQDRSAEPAPPLDHAAPDDPDQIQFTADTLEYDEKEDVVTASGNVHLYRQADRLRADKVVWNRKTDKVFATGNVVVINPQGDTAYGDSIELTDSLKDGVVQNVLLVLNQGGRVAAERGQRNPDGSMIAYDAAYTPCAVTDAAGCPKEPSWKITARKVVYDPAKQRLRYTGARVSVFNLVTIPLPKLSHPAGGRSDSGLLMPDIRYSAVNGLSFSLPYFFSLAPNRDLTVTPYLYSHVLPMVRANYRELNKLGAFSIEVYGTDSRRSDDLVSTPTPLSSQSAIRGYINGTGTYHLGANWTLSGSLRLVSDRTFLLRYDISTDDRLRDNLRLEHIDRDSYFSVNAWAVQTLRVGERQGLQPIALPEIDYRRRFNEDVTGGTFEAQLNTLALTRTGGQDTQRAFASLRWDLRKIAPGGQEIILTGYGRGDIYNTGDTLATSVASYRGLEGFHGRGIAAAAVEVDWPLVGNAFGGTQRITPKIQFVATPHIANMIVPDEDSRAIDLDDTNLFALNRFPGYDRFQGGTRVTYGLDYALYLPGFSLSATIGQSYSFTNESSLFPDGTGLYAKLSDIVGRTEIRYKDFLTLTHSYRLDKDSFAIRRNEVDATVGTRSTYVLLGYLRLNRNIDPTLEDLQDHEEARVGARVQIARFWSIFGSTLIDLTSRQQDPLSLSDGFQPVRHRAGLTYEDDCLRIGFTWKREYQDTGDARAGNSFLLSFAFKNLGR